MAIYHGWLNLYKPRGLSSAHAINIIKKIIGKNKIGHAGTLDPEAEGVLPLALGEATKLISYIQDKDKIYRFKVKFGIQTDTGDSEGTIINSSQEKVKETDLVEVLKNFIGITSQIPPKYSALKVDGERAYNLARRGMEFELKAREIKIDFCNLIEFNELEQEAIIEVKCGKGTYIRTLAEDIAKGLHNYGFVLELARLRVGSFCSTTSVEIADLRETLLDKLKPVDFVLDDIPVYGAKYLEVEELKYGRQISINIENYELIKILYDHKIVAIGSTDNYVFKIKRLFNL